MHDEPYGYLVAHQGYLLTSYEGHKLQRGDVKNKGIIILRDLKLTLDILELIINSTEKKIFG